MNKIGRKALCQLKNSIYHTTRTSPDKPVARRTTSALWSLLTAGGLGLSAFGGGTANAALVCGTATTTMGAVTRTCGGTATFDALTALEVTALDTVVYDSTVAIRNDGNLVPALNIAGTGGTATANALAVTLATGGTIGLSAATTGVAFSTTGVNAIQATNVDSLTLNINGLVDASAVLSSVSVIINVFSIPTTMGSASTPTTTTVTITTPVGTYGGDGIQTTNIGSLDLNIGASGSVIGHNTAIDIGGGGTSVSVSNAGNITGNGATGLVVGSFGTGNSIATVTITNSGSGTISGTRTGVFVTNAGTVNINNLLSVIHIFLLSGGILFLQDTSHPAMG